MFRASVGTAAIRSAAEKGMPGAIAPNQDSQAITCESCHHTKRAPKTTRLRLMISAAAPFEIGPEELEQFVFLAIVEAAVDRLRRIRELFQRCAPSA